MHRANNRLTTNLETLALAALVCSLAAWTGSALGDEATGSAAGLPAACRNAEAQFRPITPTDVQQVKGELIEALDRLDARLSQDGANGEAWRTYLKVAATREGAAGRRRRAQSPAGDLEPLQGRPRRAGVGMVRRRATRPGQLPLHSRRGGEPGEGPAPTFSPDWSGWLRPSSGTPPSRLPKTPRSLTKPSIGCKSRTRRRTWFTRSISTSSDRTSTAAFRPRSWGRASPSRSTRRCRSRIASSAPRLAPAPYRGPNPRGAAAGGRGRHHRHALPWRGRRQQRGLSPPRDDLQQLDHGAFRLQTSVDHPGWTLVTSFDRLRLGTHRGAGHPTLQRPPDDRAHGLAEGRKATFRGRVHRLQSRRAAAERAGRRPGGRAAERANRQYVEKFQRPFSQRKLFPQMLRFSTTEQCSRWSACMPAAARSGPQPPRRRSAKAI